MYGICNLSMIPVRSEPSDRSEMVSQLLFGEAVEVIDKQDSWRKVRCYFDDYIGWIDKKQICSIDADEIHHINTQPITVTFDIVQIVIFNQSNIIPVVLGSTLPSYSNKKFRIGKTEYAYDGNIKTFSSPDVSAIIEHAYMYLNAPYLWGGRSPFGIDCSGFTQMVFKLCGLVLKRDAHLQSQQGKTINLLEEAKAGDLAFFDNAEGKITHTGIILPNNKIIHSSGRVHVDRLDHQGIFNEETNKYTHTLRIIKRFF
ncbi:MAG: C40 family peptidase [Bacteroidetes bacterium]|nr:C40 family peptidase [Bacteroidota bacterium]